MKLNKEAFLLIARYYTPYILSGYVFFRIIDLLVNNFPPELFITGSLIFVGFNQINVVPGLFIFYSKSSIQLQKVFIQIYIVIALLLCFLILLDIIATGIKYSLGEIIKINIIATTMIIVGSYMSVTKLSYMGSIFKIPFGTISVFIILQSVLHYFVWEIYLVGYVIFFATLMVHLVCYPQLSLLLKSAKYMFIEKDLGRLN